MDVPVNLPIVNPHTAAGVALLLAFERFQGFGLVAAQPVAALLILVALTTFVFLRLSLLRESTS